MKNRGALAEQKAAQYLQEQGLKLIEQNYRSRFGEIDLIMQDGDTLVFVEVRQRRNADFGDAASSIDLHKQQRIILTSQHYLSGMAHMPACRFDALLFGGNPDESAQWLKNAFEA